MNANLKNSIYQQGGSGLAVRDGMLVNNRPDGETGIAQMSRMKKEMKRMKKIDMIAEGVNMGNMKTNTNNIIFGF